MPAETAIELDGLTRAYGERIALADLSLDARAGPHARRLRPQRRGKSTLLRVLATLLRPTAGVARVLGRELPGESWAVRGRIGFLGHEPLLYRELTGAREPALPRAAVRRRRSSASTRCSSACS